MTITNAPLEKQIVNLELAKGVDERTRPELMAGFTTVENLVQDQTGAWVKRPGTLIGLTIDGTAPVAALTFLPKKIVQLVNGWGIFADNGYLYHKQDYQSTYRTRQRHMDLSDTQAFISGSSGPVAQDNTAGAYVKCCASSTYHDAYVVRGLTTTGLTGNDKLTIRERSSGTEYSYDLAAVTYPSTGGSGGGCQMVFVTDRYLHIYVASSATPLKLSLIVIDTLAAMPPSEASFIVVNVTTLGAGTINTFDAVGGSTRSWILFGNSGGQSNIFTSDASTGANIDSVNFPTDIYTAIDVDESAGNVWVMSGGATTVFTAVSTTSSSTVTVARFTSPNPGSYISCNTTDHSVRIIYGFSATFGGSTVDSFEVLNLANAAVVTTVVGAAYGWGVASKPWYMSTQNKHFVQLTKYDTTNEISSHVIADISTFTRSCTNNAGLAIPFGSFRNACNVEPMFGIKKFGGIVSALSTLNGINLMKYQTWDSYEVSVCVPYQAAQRVEGISFHRLRLNDAASFGSANFSGSTYVAHGGLNSYDGRNLVDQGFSDMPIVNSVTPGATAGNLAGSYRYVAVYRHVDANGVSTYSRTFGPVSTVNVAASTGKNNITIQPPAVTNRDDGVGSSLPFVELYRTKTGGTIYYLCASSQAAIASSVTPLVQPIVASGVTALLTVTDNLSDTSLGSQAVMFRQPGTTNAPADRYAAPASKILVQHKDRLFCVDPYGQRVFYSSFFVDGEAAWFNPAFNFFLHNGTGPVTALASMDGRLFVFKRDAIFVVDGDGPGEAGPTGNEFSPPQSLASRFGCIDHRSLVVTPEGIIYRSTRGIEMLTRSLQVKWIGERVQNTVDTYRYTTGACVGPDARVHMTLALVEGAAGTGSIEGREIVYDLSADCWSTGKYTGYLGSYGKCFQGVAVINDSGTEKIAYADNYLGVYVADDTIGMDYTNAFYVPFVLETGWIKQGPQARQRVSDILFLAKKLSGANHAIKMSFAYNYSDTYTQTHTWEPGDFNAAAIEELNLQPSTQQVLAIRVKIEDQAPADTVTYPIGTGKGCDILAVSAEVASKQGAPKLAAGQKA